jgi:hypothetical protein
MERASSQPNLPGTDCGRIGGFRSPPDASGDEAVRPVVPRKLNRPSWSNPFATDSASGFQAPGTDPLLVSIRKAMSTVMSSGYSPDTLILRPADAETLDTLRTSGSEAFYVFAAGNFAPSELFGLRRYISKTVAAPIVMDAGAFGKLYASPLRLQTFEQDSGQTNKSRVRIELNAQVGVERQAAAVRIAAS